MKPAGGIGALKGTWTALKKEKTVLGGSKALMKVNQPDGFDCPGCAWPEPEDGGSAFEFCENGAKAVAAETTSKRVTGDFLHSRTIGEWLRESDYELEGHGRLTEPVLLKAGEERYSAVSWEKAFEIAGQALQGLETPDDAIFYTSGRTSNEAAFLYQLFARRLGTNNLPDCSNLCHESSGVGLSETIGIGKGTVQLRDFEVADCILVIGQNPGTNHPRMLATLQEAARRGAQVIAINPIREAGLVAFTHPKEAMATLLGKGTTLATHYLQPRVGTDIALLNGMMKHLLAVDAEERGTGLDWEFIQEHTTGFEALREGLDALSWDTIVQETGISRSQIEEVATIYGNANASIACWAMGITQHVHGVHNVQAISNLLLLKGNMGREGAGACPVRGHSNVQGDRTMGIVESPKPAFLKRLGEHFSFKPPEHHGVAAIAAIESMLEKPGKVFVGMGGNFAQATSDTEACHRALQSCSLTIHVSTKLNRSHLIHGQQALIFPCLARSEVDTQQSGAQFVTVEDSMGVVHGSRGHRNPPSETLLSEVSIVTKLAQATFPDDGIPWASFRDDYGQIRKSIEAVIPGFESFEERVAAPGGFALRNSARERDWKTASGKAQIIWTPVPKYDDPEGSLCLFTIRSHDQYNTTIYGLDDRYRGIKGNRMVLFMHPEDLAELKIAPGSKVRVKGPSDPGEDRQVEGFTALPYDLPKGSCAGYFPETNPLIPRGLRAHRSETPASKRIPVHIEPMEA